MTKQELKFILIVIAIFIAACVETDIYLPAFPDMMAYFSASEEAIQSLLTWNFIGICISGPLYGPISDSIGRKKPLLIALGLFFLGSLITLFATDFTPMLWGRLLQGLGSGGCFTLGTAIIFDAFKADKAISAINKINSIVPFIMAAAPLVGGYLNHFYGFRSNFLAIAFCVVVSIAACLFLFDETLPQEKRSPFKAAKFLADLKSALFNVPFWQLTIVVSLLFAGYIAFLSGCTLLFVLEFGVSKQYLAFFQAPILIAWLAASLTFGKAIQNWGIPKIKLAGTLITLSGGFALVLCALFTPKDPYTLTTSMMLYAFGVNWTQGLYFPEGMEILPDIKGITASLLTSARLLITAVIVALTSSLYNSTIFPVIAIVAGIILIVVPILYLYEKQKKIIPLQASNS